MSRVSYFLISLFFVFILGCQQKSRDEHEIYIGTISGPETELMEVAKTVAKEKYNLEVKIFEFEDYTMPNTALAEGSIDANMFQHQPFLDIANQERNFNLISIGKMYIYPMGIYSKRYTQLQSLPAGAKIGIPNDPSNEARALKLLEKAGLITLSEATDLQLTPDKIKQNPKNLHFQEVTAAQLPRSLDDFDAACINTNYALAASLSPADALFKEDKDSPYVNIVVINNADKDKEKFKQLMLALHSEEVEAKAKELFGEYALPGWK